MTNFYDLVYSDIMSDSFSDNVDFDCDYSCLISSDIVNRIRINLTPPASLT